MLFRDVWIWGVGAPLRCASCVAFEVGNEDLKEFVEWMKEFGST